MKKTLICAALAASLTLPLLASAATREAGEWFIAPAIGYGWADPDRLSGDARFLGFGMGYFFKDNWSLEGNLGYHRFDHGSTEGGPLEWNQLSVNGTVRYLMDYGQAHPYFGLAVGAGRNEIRHANSDEWGYQIGPVAGFEWDVGDSGAFRFELSHKYTDYDNGTLKTGFWDTTASVGYSFYFGGNGYSEASTPPPSPPMPPSEQPAPMPEPEPQAEPARPLPVSITLNGVNFDFDKCTLRNDAIEILDEAVRVLNGNDIRVEVAGHTDAVGTDAYNQKLSECRAHVVADYLTGHGVANAEISAVNGYGESKPIDTNDTAEGRARNRRTELNVQ